MTNLEQNDPANLGDILSWATIIVGSAALLILGLIVGVVVLALIGFGAA